MTELIGAGGLYDYIVLLHDCIVTELIGAGGLYDQIVQN